jgi:hypothetical protein
MISIMPESESRLLDVSFPNSKLVVRNIFNFRVNKDISFLIDKPDLYHWVLVSVSNTEVRELAELTKQTYDFAAYSKFGIYTIITAKDVGALSKKSNFYSVYARSFHRDRLLNLRWTSSRIRTNSFREIVSLTSPIQLLGSYRGCHVLYVWASGFRSIMSNGYLEVRLSFHLSLIHI